MALTWLKAEGKINGKATKSPSSIPTKAPTTPPTTDTITPSVIFILLSIQHIPLVANYLAIDLEAK